MDPTKRIVTHLPLSELWDSSGPVRLARQSHLSSTDVACLLRSGVREFVVADVGRPLRWIAQDDCFDFWKRETKSCIADSDQIQLERFPDGRAYLASSWSDLSGRTVIVLEVHH